MNSCASRNRDDCTALTNNHVSSAFPAPRDQAIRARDTTTARSSHSSQHSVESPVARGHARSNESLSEAVKQMTRLDPCAVHPRSARNRPPAHRGPDGLRTNSFLWASSRTPPRTSSVDGNLHAATRRRRPWPSRSTRCAARGSSSRADSPRYPANCRFYPRA